MKKLATIVLYIFIIAVFGIVIFKFYKYYQQLKTPIIPAICAVDDNAFAILEIKNPASFLQFIQTIDSNFINDTANTNNLILKKIAAFNTSNIINIFEQIQSLYLVLLSYNNQIHYQIIFNAVNNFQKNNIEKFLTEQILTSASAIIEHYIETDIKKISYDNNKQQLFFTISKGVFIISPDLKICKNAILQTYNEHNLLKNKTFLQLQDAAGKNVDANLYFNYPKFITLLKQQKNKVLHTLANYLNITQWSVFDISFKNTIISLDGISTFIGKDYSILQNFNNCQGTNNQMHKIIPDNTIFYTIFSYQNSNALLEKYYNYIQENKLIADTLINQIFNNNQPLQICELITLDDFSHTDSVNKYFIIYTTGANQIYKKIYENYFAKKNIDTLNSGKFFGYKIINFFKKLPFPVQVQNDSLFFLFADNFVIFSENNHNLLKCYRKYKYQQLLKYDVEFNKLYEGVTDNSNYQLYCNPAFWKKKIENIFLKNLNTFIFNYVNHGEYFFSNGLLDFSDYRAKNKLIICNDSFNCKHPIVLINNFIVVADNFNNLRFYNCNGQQEFSKSIKNLFPNSLKIILTKDNEPYLFCRSADTIYFIAANDNGILKKGIKHKWQQGNIIFTDFTNQHIFLLNNNEIINYDINKTKIVKSVYKYKFPLHSIDYIQHFSFEHKDYFFVKTKNKKLAILRTDGKPLLLGAAANLNAIYQTSDKVLPLIIAIANKSDIIQYNYISQKWELLFKIKENINISNLAIFDVDNDKIPEIYIAAGKQLFIYNVKGEVIKKLDFVDNISFGFITAYNLHQLPSKLLVIKENNFWYLLNAQMEVEQGYPIQGEQLIVLKDKNKETRIITAGSKIIITRN